MTAWIGLTVNWAGRSAAESLERLRRFIATRSPVPSREARPTKVAIASHPVSSPTAFRCLMITEPTTIPGKNPKQPHFQSFSKQDPHLLIAHLADDCGCEERPQRRHVRNGSFCPQTPKTCPHKKLFGQIIVRHICAVGDPSNPSPSSGSRKFLAMTPSSSSGSTTGKSSKK